MTLVAAGVLWSRGAVLACRRRDDQEHAGRWEFPGGKVEAGESPAEALRRELREELRIEVRVGREIERYRFEYRGGKTVELVFFEVESWLGEPDFTAFAAARWVSAEELVDVDFLEGDRLFLARLAQGVYK